MTFYELEAPERWIAALEDDRLALRSWVLTILTDFSTPPVEAVMPAIRMVDRHGWGGAFQFSYMITKLPHTEESFAWLVARLRTLATQDACENELMHLSRWFGEAPVEWIAREFDNFVETLMASTVAGGETIRSKPVVFRSNGASFTMARMRLSHHQLSSQKLRERAEELFDLCVSNESFPRAEVNELEILAQTLASRGECLREAAGEWLDLGELSPDSDADRDQFRAGFALMLLAAGRIRVPVPKLINLLALDWDWMNELYESTLSAVADARTISDLLAIYPSFEWYQRLYTSSVIQDCWHRENEAAVLQAAKNEEDDHLRVALVSGLVLHGSPDARDYARRVADEEPRDPERQRILEMEIIREVVGGRETAINRAKLEDMGRVMVNERARYEGFARLILPTINNQTMADTGRNDPCPCGSGIKFKKCCMK